VPLLGRSAGAARATESAGISIWQAKEAKQEPEDTEVMIKR
jgi:hypothetical protein